MADGIVLFLEHCDSTKEGIPVQLFIGSSIVCARRIIEDGKERAIVVVRIEECVAQERDFVIYVNQIYQVAGVHLVNLSEIVKL